MGQVIPGTQVTLANDRGAIVKQSSSPGTAQSGANINVDGQLVTGSDISTSSGNISTDTGYVASKSSFVGAATGFYLGTVIMLARGSTFPTSSLVDGQRYYHTTYRAWFTYNSTDSKWRQEGPGVFDGSFPTVASGDNTVAPKIEVKRLDRNNIIYYWDGTRWLSTIDKTISFISRSNEPFAQGVVGFDLTLPNYASGGGFYFTNFSIGVFPNTTQSGSNYYDVSAQYTDTSGSGTSFTFTANNSTLGMASGGWRSLVPTFTPVAVTTHTAFMLYLQMTPHSGGSPGTFYMTANVTYQLIG